MHRNAQFEIVDYLRFFEGYAEYMYLDSVGKVTTGIGVLLDPFENYGMTLPWFDAREQPVTDRDTVKAEFDMVKSHNGPKGAPVWVNEKKTGQTNWANFRNFASVTTLHAKKADIDKRVLDIVLGKEKACRGYFGSAAYDGFPADVQVVLTQMAYAGGLVYRQSQLAPLLAARDWLKAREFTYLTNATQGKDGYRKYNACFRQLMLNAYIVEECAKLPQDNVTKRPTDITQFYGYKKALTVMRYFGSDNPGPIEADDQIVTRNLTEWLNKQV